MNWGLLPSRPPLSLLPPAWIPGLLSSPSLGSNFEVRGCQIYAPLPGRGVGGGGREGPVCFPKLVFISCSRQWKDGMRIHTAGLETSNTNPSE